MKRILPLLSLLLCLAAFTACEDNLEETQSKESTDNWKTRNADYFHARMDEAKAAVAAARQAYGDDWEAHCDWRVYRSYAKMPGGIEADSICAKVVERGEGADVPLYTDSVKVNYVGRLMPTQSYEDGLVFDHSGLYAEDDYVFNPQLSQPASFLVSNLIEGYTTALLHMHVGDRWRIFIPQELGYTSISTKVIPPYSTLVFDLQLRAVMRP